MSVKSVTELAQEITDRANQTSSNNPAKSDWKAAAEQVYIDNLPEGITEQTLQTVKSYNEVVGKAITQTAGRAVVLECKASVSEADSLIINTPLVKYTVGVVKRSKKDGERKIYSTTSVWTDMRAEVNAIAEEWINGTVQEAKVESFDDL